MKKTILSILSAAFFTCFFTVYAQSISIVSPNTEISGQANEFVMKFEADVINLAESGFNFKVKRKIVTEVSGTFNLFCVGIHCYTPEVSESDGIYIEMGATDTTFKVDYYPEGNVGETVIDYCFYNEANISDSTCIRATFSVMPVSVERLKDKAVFVSAFPNPATENVNINYNLPSNEGGRLMLINALGSEVFSTQLNNKQGQVTIPRGNLPAGMYFYKITTSTEDSGAKKLILR
ncbi:MAG: T9SS type A sorting domain-containing protein [Bacteroidetes bacterium]|nr:T9SS type A sorting domain-containing protein [Bacteroidota bacterium]